MREVLERIRGLRALLMAALLALALVAIACGSDDSDDSGGSTSGSGGGAETIEIGGLAPLSGVNSEAGEPQQLGMEIAVDDYNKAGGIEVGGKKYKLALTTEDSGSDNTTITAATTKLTRDEGIKYLIGPVNAAAEAPGLAPVSQKAGALLLAMYPQQILAGEVDQFPYVFNVKPDTPSAASGFASGVPILFPDTKRVFILMENSAAGKAQVEMGYVPYLKSKGIDVEVLYYNKGTVKDYTGFLTKAKAFDPDVLMYGYEYSASLAILKQALQLGVADAYYDMTGACCDAALKDAIGKPIDKPAGFLASPRSLTYTSNPEIKEFGEKLKAKIGRDFELKDSVSIIAYYQVQLIAEAMKAAGSTDVAKIADSMVGSTFETIYGDVTFTEAHNAAAVVEDVCVVQPGSDPECQDLHLPPADFKPEQ